MKKIFSIFLAVILALCVLPFGAYAENEFDGQLNVINYNVDGLPVPSFISSTGKNPIETAKEIGNQIGEMNVDILGVQEDFEFHSILKKHLGMTDCTYSNGGTGTGSGVNIFSSKELFNVGRESWTEAYGVFDAGSDELTPKGVVYATVDLGNGAYVDIYDCHIDAWSDPGSEYAKKCQYLQLMHLVNSHSGNNHAVIIMGDMNAYFSEQAGKFMKTAFVDENGFKEAWVEANIGGDYDTDKYAEKFGYAGRWGKWDSAEKIFYRSSNAVKLDVETSEYVYLKFDGDKDLSDHAAQLATLNYKINAEACKTEELKENKFNLFKFIIDFEIRLFKTIFIALKALPGLISGETKILFLK